MNVLLEPPHIIIACMEIVSTRKPLVLLLLFFDVILSLLHIYKHFFQVFVLFVSLWQYSIAFNVFANLESRGWEWLNLEINDCSTDLDCFGLSKT